LLKGETQLIVQKPKEKLEKKSKTKAKKSAMLELNLEDQEVYNQLVTVRKKLAVEEGVPSFMIFSNKTLKDMVLLKPKTKEQFLLVCGVGQTKCEKYHASFTRVF